MKFAALISYDGTNYRGWQRQKNVISVQEVIENTISDILKTTISVVGCGRTDRGVHAHHYVLHFESESDLPEQFIYIINKRLPRDIVFQKVMQVSQSFNAQFDATSRTYHYYFHHEDSPFLNSFSTFIDRKIYNLTEMSKALDIIATQKDFYAFCKSPEIYNTTLCNIFTSQLQMTIDGNRGRFVFSSNRFLRAMIRIMVYRLFEVGYGKMTIDQFEDYFKTKPALNSNDLAYPQGLSLFNVTYKNNLFNQFVMTTDTSWKPIKSNE